jgi:hypothetical protein
VLNSCVDQVIASPESKSYDWFFNSGDTFFSYDLQSYFNIGCKDTTVGPPTYSFIGLTLQFSTIATSKVIQWTSGVFSADAVYTVTVQGTLPAPHTMTVTKIVTIYVAK